MFHCDVILFLFLNVSAEMQNINVLLS